MNLNTEFNYSENPDRCKGRPCPSGFHYRNKYLRALAYKAKAEFF